jgi:hypothetical protein
MTPPKLNSFIVTTNTVISDKEFKNDYRNNEQN